MSNSGHESVMDEFSRYRIGVTVNEYDPAKERYKNMLHLVAYDIREAKRLRRVAQTCEDFGLRVEYSVFECDLDETRFARFWEKLLKIIDQDEDSLIAYRICGACVSKIKSCGSVVRPGRPLLYIL